MNAAIQYSKRDGGIKQEIKSGYWCSYIHFFLESHIYRENCYSCPFASQERVSDITLGDYWGFHQEYPAVEKDLLDGSNGVSCVLINTQKGQDAFEACREQMVTLETTIEKIARHNGQLQQPSRKPAGREQLLERYREQGYEAMEAYYRKKHGGKWLLKGLVGCIPVGVKRFIRRMLGRVKRTNKRTVA